MPTVELRFTALPEHVRTARLVAVSLARRAGVEEQMLDEIRLAVGEAASRAVGRHLTSCPSEPVLVRLTDGSGTFIAEVLDVAGEYDADAVRALPAEDAEHIGNAPGVRPDLFRVFGARLGKSPARRACLRPLGALSA